MAKDINSHISTILGEIGSVLKSVDQKQVDQLISLILDTDKIIVCGAGRVGMAIRGFGMRLGHLGLKTWTYGDSTVPAIADGDLLLVASGSGETQTIYDLVEIGKKNGTCIGLITSNPGSRMGKLADQIVVLKTPSKAKQVGGFTSVQPMTTLNEQCLGVFFDALVLMLMEKMKETHYTMWARHSNLE
jgi:6-phospho-3-hexuloisomerase